LFAPCTDGLARASSTFTDADGNSLSFEGEGPVFVLDGNSVSELTLTMIGGTGIYERATGIFSCRTITETEGNPLEGDFFLAGRLECQEELSNE
jgi:hypothetical protein